MPCGEFADAVLLMHDIVADGEVGIGLDPLPARGQLFCGLRGFAPGADKLRVRQHRELEAGVFKARGDRADGDGAAAGFGQLL